MTRLGFVAAGLLVLGLWLPWGTLSVGLLGGDPVDALDVSGQDIGSGIVDLPVGWIAAGGGVLAAAGLYRWSRAMALTGAAVALAATGYTFLAIPGDETARDATSGEEAIRRLPRYTRASPRRCPFATGSETTPGATTFSTRRSPSRTTRC